MKKMLPLLLLLLPLCLFAGCENHAAEPLAPLEEMPTQEEMADFKSTHTQGEYEERMLQIKALIDGTSDEELRANLRRALEDWAEGQTEPPISRVAVEFYQDDLLMDEQRKQKAYQNMDLKVEVFYEAEQANLTQDQIAQQIADPAFRALMRNYYGWARIRQVELTCYNMEHRIQYGASRGNTMSADFMIPPQPEEELAIQRIVYYYIDDFNSQIPGVDWSGKPPLMEAPNVTLRHFGVKPDAGELYLEIPIYLYDTNMTVEAFRQSLAGRSEELARWITGDAEAAQYLKDSGAETITVEFYTPWDAASKTAVYRYPLSE